MTAPARAGVRVRQAVRADLDVLVPLFDRYRQFQQQPADPAAARTFLQARFEHGESVVFIAELPDARDADAPAAPAVPVGFAQLYPSFSSTALARVFILNDLFVDAAGRRRGVATRLLDAVESHAWACGAARVTLNVARENTEAQALYAARGWVMDSQFFMLHRHPPPARG